ncbi:MAG: hypothetical protein Fur0041_14020 [Bacteroidia bacterium]
MLDYTGKHLDLIDKNEISKYDNVHIDLLWYLTKLTKVNRLMSRESIREFLIRFFLITDINLDRTALEFINKGKLIEAVIGVRRFSLSIGDLVALRGFANNTSSYNIWGTLEDFIETYEFKAPNIKIAEGKDENTIAISRQAFIYAMMGLHTLLEIDSFSLNFKKNLHALSEEEKQRVIRFADYVVSHIEEKVVNRNPSEASDSGLVFKERFIRKT